MPLAVQGLRLAALAAGRPVPPVHEDGDVRAEIEAAIAAEPVIAGFSLAPSQQVDLTVRLHLAAGDGAAGDRASGARLAAYAVGRRRAQSIAETGLAELELAPRRRVQRHARSP